MHFVFIPPQVQMSTVQGGVETMSEEEVVHCVCGRAEGDGLMLQCDVCLTWQHGLCLAIFSEDQVSQFFFSFLLDA